MTDLNYGNFDPWLDHFRPTCSCSIQKLDRSTQVTEFGLGVDERTRNNLYVLERTDWLGAAWSDPSMGRSDQIPENP